MFNTDVLRSFFFEKTKLATIETVRVPPPPPKKKKKNYGYFLAVSGILESTGPGSKPLNSLSGRNHHFSHLTC